MEQPKSEGEYQQELLEQLVGGTIVDTFLTDPENGEWWIRFPGFVVKMPGGNFKAVMISMDEGGNGGGAVFIEEVERHGLPGVD